jgi:putative flippase GtrA
MKQVVSQFMLFSAVGAIGTAAHFAVLIVLVQFMASGPIAASMAGFGTGALVNYGLNYHITFGSKSPHSTALPKFLAVAIVGLILNTLIMYLFTSLLHYLLSQVIATIFVLGWNFLCNRFWTFRLVTET